MLEAWYSRLLFTVSSCRSGVRRSEDMEGGPLWSVFPGGIAAMLLMGIVCSVPARSWSLQ